MSEQFNSKRFNEGSKSQNRSSHEQQRLMNEYNQQQYESGLNEAEYDEAMAERELEAQAIIEDRIMGDAEARRMYMMAQHIAELRSTNGTEEVIKDKEDKLQDLLEARVDGAYGDRSVAFTNAAAERSTPKGDRIRLGKEVTAEEELAKRLEEVDFILNASAHEAQSATSQGEGDSSSTPEDEGSEIDPTPVVTDADYADEEERQRAQRQASPAPGDVPWSAPQPDDEGTQLPSSFQARRNANPYQFGSEEDDASVAPRPFTASPGRFVDGTTRQMPAGELDPEDWFGPTPIRENLNSPTMNPADDPIVEPGERRSVAGTLRAAPGSAMNFARGLRNRNQPNDRNGERRSVAGTAYAAFEGWRSKREERSLGRQNKISSMEDGTKKKLLIGGGLAAAAIVGVATWYFAGKNGWSLSGSGPELTVGSGAPTDMDALKSVAEQAQDSTTDVPEVFHFPNDPQAGLSTDQLNEVAEKATASWNIPEGGGLIDAMEQNGLDGDRLTVDAMNQLIDKYPDEFEWHTYADGTRDLWVKTPGDLPASVVTDVQSL